MVISDATLTPFTTGLRQPVICLPAALAGQPGLWEPVLAHELAHVRRGDVLWLRLQSLVLLLFFFHPVAWLAARRLHHSREALCDRLVLQSGTLPAAGYARSLLAVLKLQSGGGTPALYPTLSYPTRRLAMRLESILEPTSRRLLGPLSSAGLTLLAGLLLLPMATPRQAGAAEQQARTVARTVASPAALHNPLPEGRVTSAFGPRKDPFSGSTRTHTGIDLAAPTGTVIAAPADATVEVASERFEAQPGAGTVVVLDHGGGLKTFFAHLGTLEVSPGQKVSAGQAIARVGVSGLSTGPHLHFEVLRDGQPVDPAALVAGW